MPELYTSSRLKVLRRCLAEHHMRYRLGLIQPASPDATFGTNGHLALEAYFKAWQAGRDRIASAIAVVDAVPNPVERAKLRALVNVYHLRWGGEPWEVLAVEVEFRFALDQYQVGGKIDAIVRSVTDGRVYVLEHKTTGSDISSGTPYWEKLAIDTQVSVYVDGARVIGHDVAGVIYDVLQRPEHEPLLATPVDKREYTKGVGCKPCGGKAGQQGAGCEACLSSGWKESPRLYAKQRAEDESIEDFTARVAAEVGADPERFLKRGEVVRLADELPKMRLDLMQAIWFSETAAEQGIAPRNPDACVRFRSLCPYFDICAGRADVNDTTRFPRGAVHAELAPNP